MSELTGDGLVIDTQAEITADLEADQLADVDPSLSFAADTVLGQQNNIYSESLANLNLLVQAVYNSAVLSKAEGKNLDDLATLRNVTRLAATASSTNSQQFIGSNGTFIPSSSIFENPITGDQFTNPADVSLDATACISSDLEVADVLNSTEYTISVEGVSYSYESSSNANANEIVTNLETLINADIGADYTASVSGDTLTILSDDTTEINIVVITYIAVVSVTTQAYIECTVTGAVIAPANSITEIITVVPGLDSTTNLETLALGQDEETDEELRIRVASSGSSNCTGTINSIETALLNNVTGVTSAEILENDLSVDVFTIENIVGVFQLGELVSGGTTGSTGYIVEIVDSETLNVRVVSTYFEEGEEITGLQSGATADLEKDLPGKTYETVVVGGDDDDVANEIWITKPAGIRLYGNTAVVIQDSNGNDRTIYFTRATALNIAVQVTYSLYDEESFPVDGDSLIEEAVLDTINSLGVNEDVIPGRLYGPIYAATPGIGDMTVEVQEISAPGVVPDPGEWQTDTLVVANDEFASITSQDIYLVQV